MSSTSRTDVPVARSADSPPRLARHLLMFNLAMDEDDPILGFAVQWVNALAAHVERLSVITMRVGRLGVRDNIDVHSVGGELRLPRSRRIARFYGLLARLVRTDQVDVCFSHMMPKFSALGGPLLRVARIPLITWYAHPTCTMWLRAAHMMSDRVVTSFAHTYPYKRDKVHVIGQAIDTDLFSPPSSSSSRRGVLCVGRLSPVKNLDVLLKAFARVREGPGMEALHLRIIGRAPGNDDSYPGYLRETARGLGIVDQVEWIPGVPHDRLVEEYRRAMVHVNLTERGFGDKVALEAMSCGAPCVVANNDFEELLGHERGLLLVPPRDIDSLSNRIARILTISLTDRTRLGDALRRSVERGHSLSTLPNRLACVLDDVRRSPRDARDVQS